MGDTIFFLIPEMILFVGVVAVTIMGLSPSKTIRDWVPGMTCLALLIAAIVTPLLYRGERIEMLHNSGGVLMPMLGMYVKIMVCIMGIGLAMLSSGLIDRRLEASIAAGRQPFDALRMNRGEYFAFFLLSLIGVMLCCNARDLIWLFLALELTSLPTYIMVAISRPSPKAQEAAVKYFFLGAMSAAVFLYGFALLYGATGTIVLTEMRQVFIDQWDRGAGEINSLAIIGLILSLLGVSFKIAAAPMHFYAADVYEGAAAPVTAFLAFVPKTAGMIAIILLLATIGWGDANGATPEMPRAVLTTLWMIAVLTMTLGNIGALLQRNVKRLLAYSSIAHSGYLLIGVIAGPGIGINGVLFYLFTYGVMNIAVFGVVVGLERRGQELESLDDLAGLRLRHPLMAAVLAIAALSLLGVPPLLGFVGKLYLFVAGVESGHVWLVVIAGLNSAISAWYYLGLPRQALLEKPSTQAETIVRSPFAWPRLAAVLTTIAIIVVPFFSGQIIEGARRATLGYDVPLNAAEQARRDVDDDALPQHAARPEQAP